jgi:hypothetical protein
VRRHSFSLTVIACAAIALPAAAAHSAQPVTKKKCDPAYKGRCLRPDVSDYDCAGGSGNGPYYVSGPFRVVGNDHYRLDADHDGIACER